MKPPPWPIYEPPPQRLREPRQPVLRKVPGSMGVVMGVRICIPPCPRPGWWPANRPWDTDFVWCCDGLGGRGFGATEREAWARWRWSLSLWRRLGLWWCERSRKP